MLAPMSRQLPLGVLHRLVLTLCALLLLPTAALGGPPSLPAERLASVPPELKPWIPWVLAGHETSQCVARDKDPLCLFPGSLSLDVRAKSAEFELLAWADAPARLRLPGSVAHWPERVSVDGKSAVVLDADGLPTIDLAPGDHRISGEFHWEQPPETLALGGETGLVSLRLEGRPVAAPRRESDGTLWLQTAATSSAADALSLELFRRVNDGVPVTVLTRLVFEVSGNAREVKLGKVLPAGTVALRLNSPLPAQLDPDGTLTVQVRAGTHQVELDARVVGDAPKLTAPKVESPSWPELETWVFSPNSSLRDVEIHGDAPIEPSRTRLSQDWRNLSAWQLRSGQSLQLTTRRRGEATPPPNQLELERTLWLDLDGAALTSQDRIHGSLSNGWRLDWPDAELGHVASAGRDLLITTGRDGKSRGVELRDAQVNLVAESRWLRGRSLPAVGFNEDVKSLRATLMLPPGWTLLTSSGVDSARDAWLTSFELFEFFFAVVICLAVTKLTRWYWGLIAGATLLLCHGESDAPRYIWAAIVLLWALRTVARAWLLRALSIAWLSAAGVLVILTLQFVVPQIRYALHPQLAEQQERTSYVEQAANNADNKEGGTGVRAKGEEGSMGNPAAAAAPMARSAAPSSLQIMQMGSLQKQGPAVNLSQDPTAVVQTGPGLPTWKWKAVPLGWSGPVERQHQMRLWLLSPLQTGLLMALRVGLLLALLGLVLRRGWSAAPIKTRAAAPVLLLLGLSLLHASPANATPATATLDALRDRLLAPASCLPNCLSVGAARITAKGDELALEFEVAAATRAVFRVPGPLASWMPQGVEVDGHRSSALTASPDGFLLLRLEAGAHRVRLVGAVPGNELTLAWPDTPHSASFSSADWDAAGLKAGQRPASSLQLTRRPSSQPSAAKPTQAAAIPPWLEVTRSIELGVTFRITTHLRRLTAAGTPIVLRYPLLVTERITQPERPVENGQVIISFGRDDTEASFESLLDTLPTLALSAPKDLPFYEIWQVQVGEIWSVAPSGLVPLASQSEQKHSWLFRPWPGESARFDVSRPFGSPGSTKTIDAVNIDTSPGTRLGTTVLTLQLRSSLAAMQRITLPAGSRIDSIFVNEQPRPFSPNESQVALAIAPGKTDIKLTFRENRGLSLLYRSPELRVDGNAVNANLTLSLPDNRWLLATTGPSWGPVLLFWPYALAVLLGAWILGRVPRSPLKTWQWLLLGAGLTQLPAAAVAVVPVWFFLLWWRRDYVTTSRWRHNWLQVGIVGLSIAMLGVLIAGVYLGLVVSPDMQVAGTDCSQSRLHWYVDHVAGQLPQPWVLSAPLWTFRLLMLAWAFWLALSLIAWLRWGYACFVSGSAWQPRPQRAYATPQPTPQPETPEAPAPTAAPPV